MLKPIPFLILLLSFAAESAFSQNNNIGIAKYYEQTGREVTFHMVVESYATDTLRYVQVTDDLDATFGAGNYTVSDLFTTGHLYANPSFDGSSDSDLLSNEVSYLAPGEISQITFTVTLSTVVDLGNGLGIYSNQAVASEGVTGSVSTDLSDWGTNPDPNDNNDPTDGGEDDPTIIDILANPKIGISKTVSLNGSLATFRFYLENLGNRNLESLSVVDDLDAVFGAGNYAINSGPVFFDNPGTITLNSGFDGSTNNNLITSGTLVRGDMAGIEMVIAITNVTDQGNGLGVYQNQATASAKTNYGKVHTDLSDEGVDPDPDGNGNPSDTGEGDPTVFTVGQEPVIGVSQTASVNGPEVTFDIYAENLGNDELNEVSLKNNLKGVFGVGNFNVKSVSFVGSADNLVLNSSFDGNFNTELLDKVSSRLSQGTTVQIQVIAENIILSDQGPGYGMYESQTSGSAKSSGNSITSDLSDDGTDPDPNGNGNPNESGENDKTTFTIARNPRIGVALDYKLDLSGSFPIVRQFYHVTNLGNEPLSSITISNSLNGVFGAGNYSHMEDPLYVSGSPTLNYNPSFNGNTNTSLLNGGSTLAPYETVTFSIVSRVNNITDQGFGLGVYQNQVTVNALSPLASLVSDVSDEGINPDPNGNGVPNDAGEDDPTVIDLNGDPSLGIALDATVNGNEITMDLYLENLGNLNYSELSIPVNLDAFFGSGNYTISMNPAVVVNPGSVTLNPAYTGSGAEQQLLDIQNSSLSVGTTAQIRLKVTLNNIKNQGLGLGNYSMQVTLTGLHEQGNYSSDLSDNGTDPDPNGNSNANENGENDATTFSLAIDPIGVAQTAQINDKEVTLDIYVESFGSGNISNVSLVTSLDNAFGAGNYSITSSPSLIMDPGTLILNAGYNGGSSDNIFSSGSTLAPGATAQIRLVLTVNTESDQGFGFGVYHAQSLVSGSNALGIYTSDFSDEGTNPDPNGNSDPGESGEDDFTPVIITGNPAVGISKEAYVNGTQVTFVFTVENLGDVTLTNFFMEDPLNPVFGSGNYSIQTQPVQVTGPGTLSLSPQFFGFNIFSRVIVGGSLRPGEKEVIRTTINVNSVSDQGNGFGIYHNGVTVKATDPGGTEVMDKSDYGLDPDPNGNGNAGDAGEDDVTVITIGDETRIGAALTASVTGQQVTFDYYLENFSGNALNSLNLKNDLDDLFGAGNYSVLSAPSLIDDPGTINLNSSFDGSTDTDLIAAGSNLGSLKTAQIRLVIDVTNTIDKGEGKGNYSNQVTVYATTPLGATASDISDNGTDSDPNGNGLAFDADESDPTSFTVNFSSIGLAQEVKVDCDGIATFTYYLQNLGTISLSNVNVTQDMDAIFGAGKYQVTQQGTYISEERVLYFNPSFNGSSDKNVLLGTSALNGNGLESFFIKVKILNPKDTTYKSSATAISNSTVTDISDSGTIPDVNGNLFANEVGENDSTAFITYSPLSVTLSSTNVKCFNAANGVAMATVTGGKSGYMYSWSPSGGTASSATNLSPGTYTVTVTDANSCTATASVVITQPDLLTATISSTNNVTCNGLSNGAIDLTVAGGTTNYQYSWSNSATTEDLTGLVAGTYSVTVRDANSCTATASVAITQPDELTATINNSNNVTCNGLSNGAIDLTVAGGTTNYLYSWSNSATSEDLTGLVAGTYSVTVTDANSCSATASVTITQPAVLIASINSSANVSCYGLSNGSIDLQVNGGTQTYTYQWTTNATTDVGWGNNSVLQDLNGIYAGSYSVTVTDANSCTATASVIISQPDVLTATISSSNNVTCNGLSNGAIDLTVAGGTTNYQYSWSNSATTEDLTGLVAGTYSVTVMDANSCTATASVTISQPNVLTATISGSNNVTCKGLSNGSIDLMVAGGTTNYVYSWSNSATSEDLTGLVAGTYSVTVTDANSCSATASVTIYEPDLLVATISSSTNVSCNGLSNGTIDLNVSGGSGHYSYSWSNSATTEDLSGLIAGTYSVTVTDLNSCSATASVTITQPAVLTATISSLTNVSCNGLSDGVVDLTVAGGTQNYSYSWSNSATTEDLTGLVAGTYSVTVTDANSCTATASVTITQPDILTAAISSFKNVTCFGGNDGSASVVVQGGTLTYQYSWSPAGGNQETASGLTVGSYTVTVTDANNCIASASVNITQPLEPSISVQSKTDPTQCDGLDGAIQFGSLNIPNGTYSFSYLVDGKVNNKQVALSGNSFGISGLPSGEYKNFALQIGSCSVNLAQTVLLFGPTFQTTASSTGPYNKGDEIQLMVASGVQFNWTGPNGFYSNSQSPVINSAKEENAGIYSAIVRAANNCVDTVSTTVVVNCLPSGVSYYLVYGDETPEIISPLSEDLNVQVNFNRKMTVMAVPNCEVNAIESMKLQLSGTTEIKYHEDNGAPYFLHETLSGVPTGAILDFNLYTFIARSYSQDDAQGDVLFGPDVFHFNMVNGSRTISAPEVAKLVYCNGESFDLSAVADGEYVEGNLFRVYLSDKNGVFTNPRQIGISNSASSINCKLPTDLVSGKGYKLLVVSTDPVVSSAVSSFNLNIIGADLHLISTVDDLDSGTGEERAVWSIKAENDIYGNSRSQFKAGKNIQLKPGFSVESGSVFSATIENQCPE